MCNDSTQPYHMHEGGDCLQLATAEAIDRRIITGITRNPPTLQKVACFTKYLLGQLELLQAGKTWKTGV